MVEKEGQETEMMRHGIQARQGKQWQRKRGGRAERGAVELIEHKESNGIKEEEDPTPIKARL